MSPSAIFSMSLDGTPVEASGILRVDVLQAADRPYRMEVAFASTREDRTWSGGFVSAALFGKFVFEGRVHRVTRAADGLDGRHVSIVAYSAYQDLRSRKARDRYYDMTDAEVARRIASELDLVAVVDPTTTRHGTLVRDNDSLVFLRERARACDFHLAVAGDKLFFSKEVPEEGEVVPIRFGDCATVEVVHRGTVRRGAARCGQMELCGDSRWKPLVPFYLDGLGPSADGRYLALRCLHRLDRAGYCSQVEFLESGVGLAPEFEERIG